MSAMALDRTMALDRDKYFESADAFGWESVPTAQLWKTARSAPGQTA
jgi:hypothetical protein